MESRTTGTQPCALRVHQGTGRSSGSTPSRLVQRVVVTYHAGGGLISFRCSNQPKRVLLAVHESAAVLYDKEDVATFEIQVVGVYLTPDSSLVM